MTTVKQLKAWIENLPDDQQVAVFVAKERYTGGSYVDIDESYVADGMFVIDVFGMNRIIPEPRQ